jgi:hypothetical protein
VPTIYRSTDPSAPVLTGETGSLVALLDAILVNGYGAKTAAGWTKAFSGTSKAAYLQGVGPVGSNQFYLRVRDDGPNVTSTFKEAWVRGYEVMTDVDTGTSLFPTAAQITNGLVWRKSATADSTARAWKCFADERTFYLFIAAGDNALWWYLCAFGDIYSLVASDPYRCIIIGRPTENSATAATERGDVLSTSVAAVTGHYIARGAAGTGSSLAMWKAGGNDFNGNAGQMNGVLTYPIDANNGLMLPEVHLGPANIYRGKLRGIRYPCHAISNFTDAEVPIAGVGELSSETWEHVKQGPNGGMWTVQTNEWETSL